jgi:hypothetical protein
MRNKLTALGVLVIAFAIFEYLFFPRAMHSPQAESLAARLVPSAIGSFRSTRRWRQTLDFDTLDVGASYREAGGVEAELDIWLGQRAPHNGIDCWYARGYPVYWQRLRTATTANGSVLFDTALFRDDYGLALLATTQCYPTGCRGSLPRFLPLPGGFGLRMLTFFEPAVAPTPISIVVRELNDPAGENPQVQGVQLVQSFDRFAAQLDLSPLLAQAIAQGAKGARGIRAAGGKSP